MGLTVASVDIIYLEQTLDAGAAESFDYICVHPYETLGTVDAGQEALFFGIVPTVRKLLQAKAPTKLNAEIQFTELGEALGKSVTNITQAVSLVKAYTLGIAQGASKIDWFEASGNRYNMGLVDDKGNAHPAYTALQRLTKHLGPTPQFVGWLRWNAPRDEYGFVFVDTNDNHVMVAWGPPVNTVSCSHRTAQHVASLRFLLQPRFSHIAYFAFPSSPIVHFMTLHLARLRRCRQSTVDNQLISGHHSLYLTVSRATVPPRPH